MSRKLCQVTSVIVSLYAAQMFAYTPKAPHKANVDSSIIVQRVSDRKIIFESNPDQLLSPASVTKLITAGACLDEYGPQTTFKTPLLIKRGSLVGGTIRGNLWIKGNGDPFLVSEKLWPAVTDLYNSGIRKIDGDLILDNSLFADSDRDESRKFGEKNSRNAYDAPISAFAVNFNTVSFSVFPGARVGDSARVEMDPYPLDILKIEGAIRTSQNATQISIERKGSYAGVMRFEIKGSIALDSEVQKIYRSVENPVIASGAIVEAFLKKSGISLGGTVASGSVKSSKSPDNLEKIYEIEGYPISYLVAGLNKFSNNFIADMLTKKIAADKMGSGTLDAGSKILSNYFSKILRDAKLKTDFRIQNGSGLDTDNRLSARQLNALLLATADRMDLFPEFLASLPASGADGTLSKRFKGSNSGMIRAKTGTLTEPITVAALAGYMQHPREGWLAFSMIENGSSKARQQPNVASIRSSQDYFLQELLK